MKTNLFFLFLLIFFNLSIFTSAISQSMMNPGFETGNFSGWTTDWDPGMNNPGQVLNWGSMNNRFYCTLIGTGIIPGGTASWTNGIEQDITMPTAATAEWSFWVDTGIVDLSGTSGSPGVGFMASLEGNSKTIEFHIYAKNSPSGTCYWHVLYPAGWQVQQYNWWKSFQVTSDNLMDHFTAGEKVKVRYQTTISQAGSYFNRMKPYVDDRPPDGSLPIDFTFDVILEEIYNDDCADAIPVQAGVPYYGTTEFASAQTVATSCGFWDIYDVWHSFTPAEDGRYVINLCDSSFDTVVTVYTRCNGDELICMDGGCGQQSKVIMDLKGGQKYLIRIAGQSHAVGPYVLNIYDVYCTQPILADISGDCRVDLEDLSIMASAWLKCNLDPPEECWD